MQNGKLLMHFCRNLVAARWSAASVCKFPKSPYTSLKLDYLCVFNKLFRVDDKGLSLQSNYIKGRVFLVMSKCTRGIISKNRTEWPLKVFTCKMGCTVAITQKKFSTNFWYQQMNKRPTAPASIWFLIFRSIYSCLCFKMKINYIPFTQCKSRSYTASCPEVTHYIS